jgi:hypothetical protein
MGKLKSLRFVREIIREMPKTLEDVADLQQIVIKPGTRTPPPTPSPQAMRG